MKKMTKRGLFLGRKTSDDRKKRDNREYREEYDREYEVFEDNRSYRADRDYEDYDYDRDYDGYEYDRDYEDYEYDRDHKYSDGDYADDRAYSDGGYDYDRKYEKEDYDRDYADDDRDYENGDDYGRGYADDDRYYSENSHNYDDEPRGYERMIDEKYDDSDYDRDYADDDRDYAEYDKEFQSADLAGAFNGDNEYDTRYRDGDYEYDGGYDDRYDNDEYGRGRKTSQKGGNRSKSAIRTSSAVEKTAAIVAVVILAGAVVTGVFYTKTLGRNHEISAFADVGSTMSDVQIVGESGLVAVADAEKAKQMTAGIIEEAKEEKVEEVVEEKKEEEEVTGGKVTFSVSSIKSDIKIKFIGKNKKLVAKVPFKVSVETPDGSKVDYEDDDKDGIIYKKDMKPGIYKITPSALPAEFSQYSLDTSTKTVTVKDKVEMKAVDVSNEVKKESQVNVAKEDTAVKNVVESTLKDTVEYVESEKIPADGSASDANGTYKEIDRSSIPDPQKTQSSIIDFTNFRTVARARENSNSPTGASTEATSDAAAEATTEEVKSATVENTVDSSNNGTENSENEEKIQTPSAEELKRQEDERRKEAEENQKKANGPVPVEKSMTLTVGDTKEIVSSVGTITISSSNGNVSCSGTTIRAEKEGTARITVSASKYLDGYIDVTVAAKKELRIKTDRFEKTVNDTIAVGDYLDTPIADCKITSDNSNVASVASNGDIKVVGKGTAKISISAYNQSKTVTVTAKEAPAKDIKINTKKITLVQDEKINIGINANDYPGLSGKAKDSSVAGVSGTEIQGKKAGKTTVTYTATGYNAFDIEVTVVDKKALLKLADGTQVYVKSSEGGFREATYADYYNKEKFFLKDKGEGNFKYKGWQTINGKTYYYNKNCEYVTGKQVIQGVEYVFGSDGVLTTSSGARGIDVSKWNGSIDWKAVRNEGIEFVIIRCGYRGSSQGALIEDPTFRTNIKGAQAAGLKVGVYFFTQAVNEAEAVEEASMVIELCKGYGLSFPVYLDVEGSNGRGDTISAEQRTANIRAFCGTIQNAGYKAGVYANKTWFTSKINTNKLTNYKIWLAQYAASPTYNATRYDMWQHTSKGKVSGISGNVDLNILYR